MNFSERFFRHREAVHTTELAEAKSSGLLEISPASGQYKQDLIEDCRNILQKEIDIDSFYRFILYMGNLLGGKYEEDENGRHMSTSKHIAVKDQIKCYFRTVGSLDVIYYGELHTYRDRDVGVEIIRTEAKGYDRFPLYVDQHAHLRYQPMLLDQTIPINGSLREETNLGFLSFDQCTKYCRTIFDAYLAPQQTENPDSGLGQK